jgi:hypothetical protein
MCCPALVAHACNLSFSGGRDQEDHGSKPDWANSSLRPYLEKNPSQKRAGGVAQGVDSEFKSQYHKKANVLNTPPHRNHSLAKLTLNVL